MEIEQRKIEDVIPYENNPRINDGAVEKVMMPLEEYGWQQPIVVDGKVRIEQGKIYYNRQLYLLKKCRDNKFYYKKNQVTISFGSLIANSVGALIWRMSTALSKVVSFFVH